MRTITGRITRTIKSYLATGKSALRWIKRRIVQALCTQKRTCAVQIGMSARGQKRTYAVQRPRSALLPKRGKAVAWLGGLSLLQAETKSTTSLASELDIIKSGIRRLWRDRRKAFKERAVVEGMLAIWVKLGVFEEGYAGPRQLDDNDYKSLSPHGGPQNDGEVPSSDQASVGSAAHVTVTKM